MSIIIDTLSARIDEIIPALINVNRISKLILADIPHHPNVGDSAITLGELAFLRRNYSSSNITGFSVDLYHESMFSHIEDADVIFLHGGGNFGDLWPYHHNFRLHILKQFPHKRIIQLPQSIHFSEKDNIPETKNVISNTKKFTLLIRDSKSFAFAQENFNCEIVLCPDMAFSIGPLKAPQPIVDYSCLLRTDKEVLEDKQSAIATQLQNAGVTFQINDWLKNRLREKINIGTKRVGSKLSTAFMARHGLPLLEIYARSRVDHGSNILARGRTVVTDRLHGYIISTLLARPRYVFDSLDGKVRAFHETWLSGETSAVFMNSVDDLRQRLTRT